MLDWLVTLPAAAVYLVLGLLALVENVIPPVPADAAVALGAFLSHRGVTTPVGVFLVTWICNVAGALAVYAAVRRHGQRLLESPLGRWLLTPAALAVIEREYLRFGVFGIFVARLLPGIRAVVPPFAGLVRMPFARVAIPVALASGLWYGALTALGAVLGAEWESILRVVSGINRTLGILALVAAVVGGVTWFLRRRKLRRQRLWVALHDALGPAAEADDPLRPVEPRAAALLVLELAYADAALTDDDRELVGRHLRERWGLAAPSAQATKTTKDDVFIPLRARVVERFARAQRLVLIEEMWQAAFAGGAIDEYEERLMTRAGELLDIGADDLAQVRARLREGAPR